jgi:spheroidene monooxygenase
MSKPLQHANPASRALNGVVVVVLFDFLPQHRSWAWLKLMQGTRGFYNTLPGLLFAKVMGSGEGGGFSLRPSSSHQGLIFLFDGLNSAHRYLNSPQLAIYREKAREWWQGILGVNSCRGSWDQQSWQSQGLWSEDAHGTNSQHVASLTRGSVRASKAMSFWRYAPGAQQDLNEAPGCELSMGLGEAPLLRQCTFSVWKDTKSLLNYAHQGAHQKAIAAAQQHGFFTESMFVRMQVLHMRGLWGAQTFETNAPVLQALEFAA